MTLGRNLLAGLGSSVWTAVLTLAVIPLYLKYLGMEAYGLVGFFATTQSLLQILDFGLAPTINRQLARFSASNEREEAATLLHTLAVVSWGMAGIIGVVLVLVGPTIASDWLNAKTLPEQTVSHSMILMGAVIACRWPIALYQGALAGMQRLSVASGVNLVMITLANGGALIVLAHISPTIEAFFIWQGVVGLLQALVMRYAAWRVVGRPPQVVFQPQMLRSIWRFSAGMIGLSFSGLVFAQMDKVLLSRLLGLDRFGQYIVATVVASALTVFISPFYNTTYPRFSACLVAEDEVVLRRLYYSLSFVLSTILFPTAMLLAIVGEDLVSIWTRNAELAHTIAPVIALLAAGTALHGTMYIPHALQLAFGKTRVPLAINFSLMIPMVPLIVVLALSYGGIGGALAWLILHFMYVLLSTFLTHRYVWRGAGVNWLMRCIGVPIAVSLALGFAGYHLLRTHIDGEYSRALAGVALAACASALTIALSPALRGDVIMVVRTEIMGKRRHVAG